MGCQTKIAAQIIDQGGDYVLGLKGNQSTLHEEVDEFFTTAAEADFADVLHDDTEETNKHHGRLEVRRYWITEELGTLSETERWKRLYSIGLVKRECWIEDRHSVERRLFINSIPADAKRFAHAVRDHWGVENRLHWRLDVVFAENASRVHKGNAPAILTAMRHLCMNLFEREPSKLRMSQKRRKAAWDDDYRAKVIFG
jgi:predicted transposase YbfD/YdcC